jgi:hypothetical protein
MEDDLAEEDLLKDVLEEASRECKRRKISNKGRKVEPPKKMGQENCGGNIFVRENMACNQSYIQSMNSAQWCLGTMPNS